MKAIHRRRLEKLADHIATGKLGHRRFDFRCINEGDYDEKGCGTLGCAWGELPFVFPRTFHYSKSGVLWAGESNVTFIGAMPVCRFLGITPEEASQLFAPHTDLPWRRNKRRFPLSFLLNNATRRQVAANIRRFLKWKADNP